MSKKITFSSRFPRARIIFMIAVVIAIPMTVWSMNNVSTNTMQNASRGSENNSSISVKMVTDYNSDGLPNFGDIITFEVAAKQTNYPTVILNCSKNGKLVYLNTAGFYPGYPTPGAQNMILKSKDWQDGEADCTATLNETMNGNITSSLATLSFHVGQ